MKLCTNLQGYFCAHPDTVNVFSTFMVQNSERTIIFSSAISGLVAVFKWLSFNNDPTSKKLLTQSSVNFYLISKNLVSAYR